MRGQDARDKQRYFEILEEGHCCGAEADSGVHLPGCEFFRVLGDIRAHAALPLCCDESIEVIP